MATHNASANQKLEIFIISNGLNKLGCYITVASKGLQGTSTLAYRPIIKLQRKWSIVNMTLGLVLTQLLSFSHDHNGTSNLNVVQQ